MLGVISAGSPSIINLIESPVDGGRFRSDSSMARTSSETRAAEIGRGAAVTDPIDVAEHATNTIDKMNDCIIQFRDHQALNCPPQMPVHSALAPRLIIVIDWSIYGIIS